MPEVEIYIGNSNLTYDKTEIQPGDYKKIEWSAKNFDSLANVELLYPKDTGYGRSLFIVDSNGLKSFIKNNGQSIDENANGFDGVFEDGEEYYLVCLKLYYCMKHGYTNELTCIHCEQPTLLFTAADNNKLHSNSSHVKINLTVSKEGVINPATATVSVQVVPIEIKGITIAGATTGSTGNELEVLNGTTTGLQILINSDENDSSTNIFRQMYGYEQAEDGSYIKFDESDYRELEEVIEDSTAKGYEDTGYYVQSEEIDQNGNDFQYVLELPEGEEDGRYVHEPKLNRYIKLTDLTANGLYYHLEKGYYSIDVFSATQVGSATNALDNTVDFSKIENITFTIDGITFNVNSDVLGPSYWMLFQPFFITGVTENS